MRTPCCHTCLAFILKFLNFLQALTGVAIIVYSAYVLNQLNHHQHEFPASATSPAEYDVVKSLNFPRAVASIGYSNPHTNFQSLPDPWFIYAFMGLGVLICCITCIGHIGTEAINGCCLCCYAVLATVFILLEVGLVLFIALDHRWEKDLPFDPTGELDKLRIFIEENAGVFQWVGIAILIIQVLSLLFAVILRSLVSRRTAEDDIEGDYDSRSSTREPLLNPYSSLGSGPTRGDSDIWSSRMRHKYGLNGGEAKQNLLNQNPSSSDAKL